MGRPASPTLGGTIDCVLSAPGSDKSFLHQWMFSPTLQEDGRVILMSISPETTLKTISFFKAFCVSLQTNFMPGAGGGGSLQMSIRISPQRVAVGAIVHDNNWPLASHGAGQRFAQPVSYQEPQSKPKPKPGLIEVPPVVGLPQPKPRPPKAPTTPRIPKLPQFPRIPKPMRLPAAVLTILLSIFPVHDAGVSNEWEHKLPEQDEQRYRELEAKRSQEIARGGKLSPREEEEFQALDKRKYPYGHSPYSTPKAPDSGQDDADPEVGGLKNPYAGKTLEEVQEGFEQQVREGKLVRVYTDPISGSVAYKNPKTGFSYNVDTGLSGRTGQRVEPPHVDVNYPNPKPKNVPPKRKFFFD